LRGLCAPCQEAPKAAADWKQHEAPDGRVYFHSKALGESRWKMPEEMRLAREAAAAAARDTAGALAGAPPASRPLPGPPPIQARAVLPSAGPARALGVWSGVGFPCATRAALLSALCGVSRGAAELRLPASAGACPRSVQGQAAGRAFTGSMRRVLPHLAAGLGCVPASCWSPDVA
jgi:hypothetical protein